MPPSDSRADRLLPRYPVYVPSKWRAACCTTPGLLDADGVPFRLVVEPSQRDDYAARFGPDRLLILPRDDGGLIFARNWIKQHAAAEGHARHWQLDDNLRVMMRSWRGQRLPCRSGIALAVTEDFVDRYENVAIAGLNYTMFAVEATKPFVLNAHVYSCTLVLNAIPHRWRVRYNDDADICLQVLADGWCTVLMNAFLVEKKTTMTMGGGNTEDLYQGDGRLKMARSLERLWPGVVTTKRRFRRPQHVVKDAWKKFDTPLRRKPGLDPAALTPNEYGLELRQVRPIKSPDLAALVADKLAPPAGPGAVQTKQPQREATDAQAEDQGCGLADVAPPP